MSGRTKKFKFKIGREAREMYLAQVLSPSFPSSCRKEEEPSDTGERRKQILRTKG